MWLNLRLRDTTARLFSSLRVDDCHTDEPQNCSIRCLRSLLASVVESHHVGMLYTVIGIYETVGTLVAGPLLAMSFRTGLDWGED